MRVRFGAFIWLQCREEGKIPRNRDRFPPEIVSRSEAHWRRRRKGADARGPEVSESREKGRGEESARLGWLGLRGGGGGKRWAAPWAVRERESWGSAGVLPPFFFFSDFIFNSFPKEF